MTNDFKIPKTHIQSYLKHQDWKLIRKELGKRSTDDNSILNQLKSFQAEKCDPASAKKAKELIGDVTIAQAKSVSLVASHFVAWVCIIHVTVLPISNWLDF